MVHPTCALHITMMALKYLGKYIEGRRMDLALESSGIYGSAIVRQILDSRYLGRGVVAHSDTVGDPYTILSGYISRTRD